MEKRSFLLRFSITQHNTTRFSTQIQLYIRLSKLSSLFGKPFVGGGRNIFVVRTRKDFAKHGFMVALVDAPSDQKSDKGMLKYSERSNEIFRGSNEHAQDIKAVVTYLKNEADIPVNGVRHK